MTQEGFKRKLTTILSADAVGYSRLMGDDEAATVKTIELYRNIISDLITQHRGRVIDSPGDNLLSEFGSVVDAVQCAVAVQKELNARNTELPDNRQMKFRIGINLGDVIQEGGRIYGDGVNIAARLEGLSDPGGICVSKTAFDQIETKLPLGYEFLGDQKVKNIVKPVGAYRVMMEPRVTVLEAKKSSFFTWQGKRKSNVLIAMTVCTIVVCFSVWKYSSSPKAITPASKDKMAYILPDKPSIAVLPFKNISDGHEYDYFCDGLTDEIIIALSKVPGLFIIARNSMFTYKGKSVLAKQVSEDLGVRYVLDGNIRTSGNRVRISVQLIDALEGYQLWTERYDKELNDIFPIYDEITQKVIVAMEVTLTKGENARLLKKGTENIEAYLKVLQGTERFFKMNNIDNAAARQLFLEAIDLDSDYPVPYAYAARTHITDVWLRFSESPSESIRQAFYFAEKAIGLDDNSETAHSVLAGCYLVRREHQKAIEAARKGVSLSPNSADSHFMLGQMLIFSGNPKEAIANLELSIRLDPFARSQYFHMLGMAYREDGRYGEAINACQEAIRRQRNNMFAHLILAATYVMNNQPEEARIEAAEVLRINPNFTVERLAKVRPHIDPENTDRFVNALRKAGLN